MSRLWFVPGHGACRSCRQFLIFRCTTVPSIVIDIYRCRALFARKVGKAAVHLGMRRQCAFWHAISLFLR